MTVNTETQTIASGATIELAPSLNLAIAITSIGIGVIWLNLITGVIIAVLGVFLLVQTWRIRLQFSPTALDVFNGGKLIRSFPYSEWSNWRVFWQPVPILFYFREVKSIHFLPILFDPKMLLVCLEKYCPQI